ncbi:MAG: zinc ribbon domain-containing protein [Nitrospinae bacterium]|nr:zinc ribbon domain-containing protein [Nitrospinota bacterium]
MPIYEYICDDCGSEFEVMQKISDTPLRECKRCKGKVRRVISNSAFVLKGGGWYVTDYPSDSRKKGMEEEKRGSKGSDDNKSSTDNGLSSTTTAVSSQKKPQ